MKESARKLVALDWILFGISMAMIIAGVFGIASGNMTGVFLVGIGAYAAYSSLYVEKVGKGTGILFIVLGAAGLVWCIFYVIFLLTTIEPGVRDWVAGSGWLVFGVVCLPMGIYFMRRAKRVAEVKKDDDADNEQNPS